MELTLVLVSFWVELRRISTHKLTRKIRVNSTYIHHFYYVTTEYEISNTNHIQKIRKFATVLLPACQDLSIMNISKPSIF